ncbi:MAG: hypothetical protein JSS64_08995 [Bacteroidetes bacterium]|nr:hypothetical protein [Bacteroidota bacterium]
MKWIITLTTFAILMHTASAQTSKSADGNQPVKPASQMQMDADKKAYDQSKQQIQNDENNLKKSNAETSKLKADKHEMRDIRATDAENRSDPNHVDDQLLKKVDGDLKNEKSTQKQDASKLKKDEKVFREQRNRVHEDSALLKSRK